MLKLDSVPLALSIVLHLCLIECLQMGALAMLSTQQSLNANCFVIEHCRSSVPACCACTIEALPPPARLFFSHVVTRLSQLAEREIVGKTARLLSVYAG